MGCIRSRFSCESYGAISAANILIERNAVNMLLNCPHFQQMAEGENETASAKMPSEWRAKYFRQPALSSGLGLLICQLIVHCVDWCASECVHATQFNFYKYRDKLQQQLNHQYHYRYHYRTLANTKLKLKQSAQSGRFAHFVVFNPMIFSASECSYTKCVRR